MSDWYVRTHLSGYDSVTGCVGPMSYHDAKATIKIWAEDDYDIPVSMARDLRDIAAEAFDNATNDNVRALARILTQECEACGQESGQAWRAYRELHNAVKSES